MSLCIMQRADGHYILPFPYSPSVFEKCLDDMLTIDKAPDLYNAKKYPTSTNDTPGQ